MSDEGRLRKRLANLKHEESQLKIRIAATEKLVQKYDQKNPQKWHEATQGLKTLREKLRGIRHRIEDIRDHLGE